MFSADYIMFNYVACFRISYFECLVPFKYLWSNIIGFPFCLVEHLLFNGYYFGGGIVLLKKKKNTVFWFRVRRLMSLSRVF